jgi:FixJ family two-component response regulator
MSDLATRRVLVIDDDSSIGEEICDTLALKNFEGLYCENIGQARRRLVGEDNLGVIIVDYHMPEMNGIEVIETLKKEIPRHLVFVMLTGDDTQSAAINAIRAQAFDFLRKPVEGSRVAETVTRAFDHLEDLIETDRENDAILGEAEALQQRVEAISEMLRHRENLVQKLLMSDKSELETQDKKATLNYAGDFTDTAPLECAPVDMSGLIQRMLPAVQQLGTKKQVQLKSRVPNQLPFLYGDQKRIARGLADLCVVLMNDLSTGDGLTIMAVKDAGELIVTFRVKSPVSARKYARVFDAEMTQVVDCLDSVEMSEMKLLGTRIVVHLHGGRISIDAPSDGEWFLRLFFPLPALETAH